MSLSDLIQGLTMYLCLIPVIALHELAHAWTASKLGDDTAKSEGRVTLNPIAHMDTIGTVLLPGIMILLSMMGSGLASFIVGWGKPVPVDPYQFGNRRRDDTLVALAGPAMNILLAAVLLFAAQIAQAVGPAATAIHQAALQMALLSLFLCFFNLLPVPPLDGSHVLKNAVRLSEEQYLNFSRFGLIIVVLVIQIPMIQTLLTTATSVSAQVIAQIVGLPFQ